MPTNGILTLHALYVLDQEKRVRDVQSYSERCAKALEVKINQKLQEGQQKKQTYLRNIQDRLREHVSFPEPPNNSTNRPS